jgi:hypothetical protein
MRCEGRAAAGNHPSGDLCFGTPKPRGGSIAKVEKRPPGRPRTGRDPPVTVRLPIEVQAAIGAWIERQPEPKPTRSEAIRQLIERGLDADQPPR